MCILKQACNGSNFGWLIQQMSINQKSGRQTFRRRFVSGSPFVSPCLTECYLQSETKIEPDLRLRSERKGKVPVLLRITAEPEIFNSLSPYALLGCVLFTFDLVCAKSPFHHKISISLLPGKSNSQAKL